MSITKLFFRVRHQYLWSNPKRKIQTLESFSQTEIDAGESILSALQHVDNQELLIHMKRHAKDEIRHGELFRARAIELRKNQPDATSITKKPDKLYKLSRNRTNTVLNSHNFFAGENFEKLGEIMYVAMLNIAEKKAEKIFSMHHDLLRHDPITHEIFKTILKDERYHVSYTAKFLQEWEKEGQKKQVNKALSSAKKSRFLNTITRKSSKFGEHMGHALLYIIYFTALVPFSILSKMTSAKRGWVTPQSKFKESQNQNHSQY